MFLPYDSIDCIMQHLAAARAVERLGLTTRVVIPRRIVDRMESRPSLKRSAADQPLNYDDRIFQLNEWAEGSADIARGFVDEYRRTCDVDAFFDVRPLERFIALRLFGAQEVAEACVNNAAVLVLPDLAYAFNRSISAFSRDANRQLFILNPHGRFRQIDLRGDFAYEEPWLATHSWPEGSIDLRRVQPLADRFVEARRVNGGQRDWNLRLAEIEDSRVKSSDNHGTVVFMHCIRDAEQVPLRFNEQEWIYAPDLFCWTRSITRIASENPASWSLRPHPASKHYEGEAAILGRLFSEAGLIEKWGRVARRYCLTVYRRSLIPEQLHLSARLKDLSPSPRVLCCLRHLPCDWEHREIPSLLLARHSKILHLSRMTIRRWLDYFFGACIPPTYRSRSGFPSPHFRRRRALALPVISGIVFTQRARYTFKRRRFTHGCKSRERSRHEHRLMSVGDRSHKGSS
jgi:hypothetical protein